MKKISLKDKNKIRQLRKLYKNKIEDISNIIEKLNVKSKSGRTIESGWSFIRNLLLAMKKRKKHHGIDIIGESNWNKLNKLWKKLRSIEEQERTILSKYKD